MIVRALSTILHNIVKGSVIHVTYSGHEPASLTYDGQVTKLTILCLLFRDDIISIRVDHDCYGNSTYGYEDIINEFRIKYGYMTNLMKDVDHIYSFSDFSKHSFIYGVIGSKFCYSGTKYIGNDGFVIIKGLVDQNRVGLFYINDVDVLVVCKDSAYLTKSSDILRRKND